jgi:hypothetical protein
MPYSQKPTAKSAVNSTGTPAGRTEESEIATKAEATARAKNFD